MPTVLTNIRSTKVLHQGLVKRLNQHIFLFPTKNLTILDKFFHRFHCRKKLICNIAVLSQTAPLQISFGKIYFETPCRYIIDRI